MNRRIVAEIGPFSGRRKDRLNPFDSLIRKPKILRTDANLSGSRPSEIGIETCLTGFPEWMTIGSCSSVG